VERVLFAPRALPPLRPDVAEDPAAYDRWVSAREAARPTISAPHLRKLHVVMVIEGRPPAETLDSLQSLAAQESHHWQLTVVLQRPWQTEVTALLAVSGIRQRFAVEEGESTFTLQEMLDTALAATAGDDIGLIYPGDVWARDAVHLLSAALDDNGVAYGDEDCVGADGRFVSPRLKPAFSPEFLLHADCVGRPLALSAEVAKRLPPDSTGLPEAWDHDIALRACEAADSVLHIPEVLCHRLIPPRQVPTDAPNGTNHVMAALRRRREEAAVLPGRSAGTVRISRAPGTVASASIIIPFRDEPRFLRACIDSIDRTRALIAPDYILVDNGSMQPETATLLERLTVRSDVRLLRDDRPFNWAGLNNAASALATTDVLVFLNNDIEALSVGWLDTLCGQVERRDVGAVGARLVYPDRRLQHCGVVLGLGGAAGHPLVGLAENEPGYLSMAVTTRECSGVTGACLATRRTIFESHGGFDEALGIDLNDIDYCLRLQESGLRVLYESAAELIHHESPSRGTAGDVRDIVHFIDRWKASILAGDPYLNPHLTRMDSSCALRGPNEEEWWKSWYAGLQRVESPA
jgi:O-antigen biosynthesis protein